MEERKWVLLLHLFFLLVKFQSVVTSSYQADQQEKDRVIDLPGLPNNLSFAQYSGHVTVNEVSGRALFYWFFEAVEEPSSKPIVIWLQGGPGCSSVGLGLAAELGPFHIHADGKTLYMNPYSWNQAANVIFLESPVGTGFSYSNNSDDVVTNGDKRTAEDNLTFLLKWFERFPQYKGREFYITGESYAGHYIPQLAEALVKYQLSSSDKSINFQGFLVGNALTDDYNDQVGVSEYLWSNGLISDQTYKLKKLFCDHVSFLHSSSDCDKVTDVLNVELGKIDTYSVFTPACITNYSEGVPERLPIMRRLNEKYDPCSQNYSALYFNLPEVQKALHVNPSKWQSCNTVIFHTWKDSSSSVLDIYRELIKSGLRIWMFSGDTDAVIPVTSTRYDIDALKLPPASPWRPWYNDGQVGGWIEQYVGLTFVTVRGAGHKVPMTKPKLALALFKSFLSGTPLPTLSTGFSDF